MELPPVTIDAVELRRVAVPLITPFRTAHGTVSTRDVLLVHVMSDSGEDGWGECVAEATPSYSSEYVDGAADVMRRHLLPAIAADSCGTAVAVEQALAPIHGHAMAKAALGTAVLDLELRTRGQSLAAALGATRSRVPAGVSVGIEDALETLVERVDGYVREGYERIKLKIRPGWDVDVVEAVRKRFGDELQLQVDANTAYGRGDARHLARLDEYGLLLIEQPLAVDDLLGHAALRQQLQTPICLDESITSAREAAQAITLGACEVVNIKPGRVGGLLEAKRIHDVCVAHGVPVWCGGMLETGIGRAANVALAALPGFSLPGDTSASSRYYERDVTDPFVLRAGHLDVPQGPGIGVRPLSDVLDEFTTDQEIIRMETLA